MDAQLGEKRNLFEEQFKAMMNMATQFTRASESPKTVLMAAAAKGRADMLALLLDAGADVNAAVPSGYDKGETALMLAAASGSAEAVQVLLARGAKADAALTDYP
ncbi:MAG: ankyrin repeat domain-containing protein [Ottowia sp.]|nr:ankyrin repeat domain-containing protein [Ottowia sp.]